MTQAGDVTSDPMRPQRVLLATLAPAALTLVVIVLGTLVIRGLARGLDGADRSGGLVLALVVVLVLVLAALTAVVSAAVLFGFLLPRGTRLRAVGAWLGACLVVALLSTRGWVPALVAAPLLTLLPLTVLGRLRWWWPAGLALAATAFALSPLGGA